MQFLRSLLLTALSLACLSVADAAAGVVVERAATQRICQVTGEIDRTTGQPTINATQSRFHFWGTDLGASFEHDGKMVFLFGDTHAMPGLDRAPDRDLIAISTDSDPEDCLRFDVLTDEDGGYRPLSVAGIEGGAFSVPTGGFSAGGAMYVAVTDRTEGRPMGRSVLARSSDGGRHFQPLYTLSTDHFISVAFAVATADGLPPGMDKAVLIWGSGNYRASDLRLAALPEDRPGERSALRYFAGLDTRGKPVWSAREAESRPLFDQPCLGEMSAAWNADLGQWLILYNCGAPSSRIWLRTAARPWGPWSPPQVVFDAQADGGYCRFMHRPGCPNGLSDPHSPQVAGDPYAPSIIPRFSRGVAGRSADIYFLMSTWNPYNTVLMKTRLRIAPEPQTW